MRRALSIFYVGLAKNLLGCQAFDFSSTFLNENLNF